MGTREENRRYYAKNKKKLRKKALANYYGKRDQVLSDQKQRRDSDPEYRDLGNQRALSYYHRNRAAVLEKARIRRANMTEEKRESLREYYRKYRQRKNAAANS